MLAQQEMPILVVVVAVVVRIELAEQAVQVS
jgi:hypothetical protein